jgi:hypothetical protein
MGKIYRKFTILFRAVKTKKVVIWVEALEN